jgi:hypothetical protein
MEPDGGCKGRLGRRKLARRDPHRILLVGIWSGKPLMEIEGVASGIENGASVNHTRRAFHTQAEAFEQSGQVPRVDQLSIHGSLSADRLQPDSPAPSRTCWR